LIRLSGGVGVYGLGASVYGYDESIVDFVSGEAVSSINHAVAIPAVGAFSGLANALTNPLVETSIGTSGNRVLFFNGVGLTPTNSNALDPGLDGVIGGGGAQFRLTFRLIAAGVTHIIIGTGYNGDGEVLAGGETDQSRNVAIAMGWVPEPGTTLLLGFGLVGLAATGRGRSSADPS